MRTMGLTEADAVRKRQSEFGGAEGEWVINGKTWADIVNSDYEYVAANPGFEDVEIWELQNDSGGWFHPVHIHLVDFKILDRNGRPPHPYELGPKDVAYVGEGEIVRVLMRFEHQRGKYMMHCHNLVHEDHDMMTQFEVGFGGDDPMHADRAAPLPAGPLFAEPEQPQSGGDAGSGSGSGSGSAPQQPATAPGGGTTGAGGSGSSASGSTTSGPPAKSTSPRKHPRPRRKPHKPSKAKASSAKPSKATPSKGKATSHKPA